MNNAMTNRADRRIRAITHAEFSEEGFQVRLDGLLRDEKGRRNLFVIHVGQPVEKAEPPPVLAKYKREPVPFSSNGLALVSGLEERTPQRPRRGAVTSPREALQNLVTRDQEARWMGNAAVFRMAEKLIAEALPVLVDWAATETIFASVSMQDDIYSRTGKPD